MGHFVEVCRRRGLKVSAGKRRVMVLGRKEGLECEVWTKRLMKVFSDGLFIWREWRTSGLLRRSMQESVLVVAQWVGCGRDGLIL